MLLLYKNNAKNLFYIFTFFIVTGVRCVYHCTCHYKQSVRVNVLECTNPALSSVLQTIPHFTDWLIIKKIYTNNFCISYLYSNPIVGRVSHLRIESSNISNICHDTLQSILSSPNLTEISVVNNSFTKFSLTWKTHSSYVERLWLGGNPIDCNCDMLWMMDWLENSTGASGKRLVQDYQDVICATGPEAGTPVYRLDKVKLKCYPKEIPIWIIIVASSVSAVILITVVTILMIHRYRRLIWWLIYKNFDKMLGDSDRDEDITDTQFDAFISFRYVKHVLQLL